MPPITTTITLDDALCGYPPSDFDDEQVEDLIESAKRIERRRVLRERARDELDKESVATAVCVLWVDAAEAYICCGACYDKYRDDQWSGATQNPHQDRLARGLHERIADGEACEFCWRDRVDDRADELADEVDVNVHVVDSDG